MNVSVVICTRNRQGDLERCLDSLAKQTMLPSETIIIDASDVPGVLQSILKKNSHLDILNINVIHTSPGLTRQRNIGVDESSGDILFFFDDDVVLEKEYIEKILDVYNNKHLNNIGGVQGIDLNIKDSFLKAKKRVMFYRLFMLNRTDEYAKLLPSGSITYLDTAALKIRNSKEPVRVGVMSGCLMSFNKEVFDEFRFDENYHGYSLGEDAEFTFRVSRKYNMYFNPSARAYHNQDQDKKNWYKTEGFVKTNIRAHVYLFQKHLRHNPLNYLAILWSWIGLLILDGLIFPNKNYFHGNLSAMKFEFFNLFRAPGK